MQSLGLAKTNPVTFGKIQELIDANEGGLSRAAFEEALEEQCELLSSGVVTFSGDRIHGYAVYEQSVQGFSLTGHVTGLSPSDHSVQVQLFASDDAEGACASPENNPQGYTGDLGRIQASYRGGADLNLFYENLRLLGNSAIGTVLIYDGDEVVACGLLQ